jgi:hypothetical protein
MKKTALFLVFLLSLAFPHRAASATAYDSLTENNAKWKANRPARYAYTYSRSCFCIIDFVRVEVDGDSVVKVAFKDSISIMPRTLNEPSYYSPDSIFARVKADLDKNPYGHDIRYNALLGYPESAGFDPKQNVADDEHTYVMDEFVDLTVDIAEGRPAPRVGNVPGQARDLLGRAQPHGLGAVFRLLTAPGR